MQGGRVAPFIVLSAVAALVIPSAASAAKFTFGVTAGEITSKSARIWGHATRKGRVKAEVAKDKRFRKVEDTAGVKAKKSKDFTVQKTMRGLKPGKKHFYRFCKRKRCSEKGTFATAPKPKSSKTIRFGYSGDTDAAPTAGETEPFWGHMLAFKSMLAEKNDFNIHMGDTMYSDSEVPEPAPVALTRAQKWAKYKLNLGEPNLTELRKSAGFYSHWDDHEFINDFSPHETSFTPSGFAEPITVDPEKVYKAGQRAFRDYSPVTYSDKDGIYRTFRWGKNLELFFIDERSFRSAKASAGGTCDNPATGLPDIAPTATPEHRALFSALAPSLAEPVSQACKDAITDPRRTMLGTRQYKEFVNDVDDSKARWKLVINEMPIQQMYTGVPFDNWEGYAFERVKLLKELQSRGVNRLAFLTTDVHGALENVIRLRTWPDDVAPSNAPTQPQDTPYHDQVIGPVATKTFWEEIDDAQGVPEGSGPLISQLFFKPPPSQNPSGGGLGMSCDQGDTNSYAEVTVSKQSVTIDYKDENGDPVLNTSGNQCGPYAISG